MNRFFTIRPEKIQGKPLTNPADLLQYKRICETQSGNEQIKRSFREQGMVEALRQSGFAATSRAARDERDGPSPLQDELSVLALRMIRVVPWSGSFTPKPGRGFFVV